MRLPVKESNSLRPRTNELYNGAKTDVCAPRTDKSHYRKKNRFIYRKSWFRMNAFIECIQI